MTLAEVMETGALEHSRREKAAAFWRQELAAQKDRLILWIPVLIAAGIGIYFSLDFEPPGLWAVSACCVAAVLWLASCFVREKNVAGYAAWLLLSALLLAFLGFGSAQLRTAMLDRPVLEKEIATTRVEGRIVDIDRLEEGQGVRLILDDLAIERLDAAQTPERIRLKVRGDQQYRIGERVGALAGLNPPSAPAIPGAFDFQQFAYFKKIGAFGFTYKDPEIIAQDGPRTIRQKVEALRQSIRLKIENVLPPREAAVATALVVGESTAITEEDWQALRIAGLAHIISISGLHVGIAAGIIFFTLRLLMACWPAFALSHPIKKYAAAAALLGAAFYTVLAGMPVPTLRSLLMTGIVLFAVMVDRTPFSLRLVAIAAAAILLFFPEALLGASFQMSFAATAAIIFFYEASRNLWARARQKAGFARRFLLYLAGIMATTLTASLATAPLSIYHFQQFAVYGIAANLLVIPVVSFIVMPAGVLALLLMPIGLHAVPVKLMGLGVDMMLNISHMVQDWPASAWTPAAVPLSAMLCVMGGALFFMIWEGRLRWLSGVLIICAGMTIATYRLPDVLVASSGKLVAIRDENGQLWLSDKRSERFAAEAWARYYGLDPEILPKWDENDAITCDDQGCRMTWGGRRIAVSRHAAGQAEDCAWADIVIASEPMAVKDCRAHIAIDYFDLWRDGAHAIWLDDDRVVSVAQERGDRPWVTSHRR